MLFKAITTIAVTVAVLAAPTSDSRRASGNGMAIPLTKYSSSPNTVNLNVLESHVGLHTTAQIIRGPNPFERNMGMLRLSAVERGSAQSSQVGVDLMSRGTGVDLYHKTLIWYGTIFIGTPPKPFTVLLDTGCSDLVVPASNGDENCRSHPNLWDTASSTTAKALNEDFQLVFKDGAFAMGQQYTDNATFAGFTADTQTIGAATTYSSQYAISEFAPDGILGLAFPSISRYEGRSPLLHTLFSEGKLPQPVFSLKLTDSGGELYVGGMNEALYIESSLAFTPVTNMKYWELKIDNIKVNDKIILTDVPATLDTGSHLFWGDPSGVLALHKAAGGKAFWISKGYYTFPCNSFPSVTFTIGGKPYLVPANALRLDQVDPDSGDCFSGIAAARPEHGDFSSWTLGSIFLQQFYTVFNFSSQSPRIGFAMLAS